MVEKRPLINILYDFYGPLLTERQRNLMELYYEQDLSLGEIADQCGITRQGVHDGLKRAGEALERYEVKLGLVRRHLAQRERLERLRTELERLTGPEAGRVRELLRELLEAGDLD